MAKRRRHTPEQIVRKLREPDRLLAEASDVADVARHLEVWRRTFVLMQAHSTFSPHCPLIHRRFDTAVSPN